MLRTVRSRRNALKSAAYFSWNVSKFHPFSTFPIEEERFLFTSTEAVCDILDSSAKYYLVWFNSPNNSFRYTHYYLIWQDVVYSFRVISHRSEWRNNEWIDRFIILTTLLLTNLSRKRWNPAAQFMCTFHRLFEECERDDNHFSRNEEYGRSHAFLSTSISLLVSGKHVLLLDSQKTDCTSNNSAVILNVN